MNPYQKIAWKHVDSAENHAFETTPENRHKKRTVAFSKSAANVFFHILTRCNLNCRHCYINPEQQGTGTLDITTIKAWLNIFSSTNKGANLILLGGEPTLHPNLSEAIHYADRLDFKSITVDTNGYLFNNILEKVTPREVDFFSFSLDGATCKTNDLMRGKGSYEKCLAGIRKAVKAGFSTSLIYTISTANIHELKNMTALVSDLGIKKFFIQAVGIRGKSAASGKTESNEKIKQVTKDEWMNCIPAAALKIAELGISVIYPKVFLKPDEPFECAGIVANNFFIFPNGRVYRCPLCEDFPLHGKTLKENTLLNTPNINESDLFHLNIPEGCVMNRLIQPANLSYNREGSPEYKIACCLLKEEIRS